MWGSLRLAPITSVDHRLLTLRNRRVNNLCVDAEASLGVSLRELVAVVKLQCTDSSEANMHECSNAK